MTFLQWMLLFFVVLVTGIVGWALYSSLSTKETGDKANNDGGNRTNENNDNSSTSVPKATLFADSFQSAITMSQRSDRYFYVVEQLGKLWRIDTDTDERVVVLDISDMLKDELGIENRGGERGLLGVAFSKHLPNQAFVSYSAPKSDSDPDNIDHIARLSQFTIVNMNNSNEQFVNERVLIDVPQETNFHHAQDIQFDTRTGYLYYSLGDGGPQTDPQGNAQNLHNLRGKLLRIAVSNDSAYTIPETNPFYNAPQKGAPEVIAVGLRNPWRFSIDEPKNRLFIGDVGFGSRESIDVLRLSELRTGDEPVNFGWNVYEGNKKTNFANAKLSTGQHTAPIYEYETGGEYGRAVVGGYALDQSNYVFSDFVSGKLMVISVSQTDESKPNGKWELKNDWSADKWLPEDKRNDLGSTIKVPSLYRGLDNSLYAVVWGDSNKSAIYRLVL